jgi:peptidyl-Asp metalloendopeptidase
MTTYLAKRIGYASLAGAALLLSSFGATAASQRAIDVLTSRGTPQAGSLPQQAKAQSGVSGVLNPAALASPGLRLTLADGTTLEARLQRTASDTKKGTQSWIGTFDDEPGSVLVLSKAKGVVTGFANYGNQIIEIQPSTGGKHVLFAVDTTKMAMGDGVAPNSTGGADTSTSTTTATDYGVASTMASSTAVVQDVLVLYTAASATKYGQATLESNIQSAVQAANQAYINSQAGVTINLVGLQQSTVTESGTGMKATLANFSQNSGVRALRDKLAADMVVLVDEDTDYCGYSSLQWTTTNGVTNYDAYSVVHSTCLSNQSLAHELGHLQGLDHNRENTAGSGWYAYSFGYRVCASDGFRDIMSYPCSTSVPRVLQFSNPNVYYNSYATGVSYELSPSTSAENTRTLNNTATTVAGYRVSSTTTTVPAAPSSLAVQNSAYNYVTVGWTDNSSNESGFKVERSPDGVTFSEISSVGSGTTSYTDSSVATSTKYYYRVRAYNSAGTSAYSNVANLTTAAAPPPPPPAPTGVAALNDADGTATVSWIVGTTTATGFSVSRQTWDSRKGVWGSATTVASVPSGVLSLIDTTGTGTYRYSVCATNSGGSSGYAGPASVTVTSATSTSRTRGKKK